MPFSRFFGFYAALGLGALGLATFAGCTPAIGDSCTSSTDCSVQGNRQCDTAQPGGYCTVVSCAVNACPGGAACVAFQTKVNGCPYSDRTIARTARSYCLKTCGDDGDCRAGYVCVDPDERAALVLDDKQEVKVCLPAAPAASLLVDAGDEGAPVCQPGADAAVPVPLDPKRDAGEDAEAGAPDAGSDADAGAMNDGGDAGADADADAAG